jgi:hypothetical protein
MALASTPVITASITSSDTAEAGPGGWFTDDSIVVITQRSSSARCSPGAARGSCSSRTSSPPTPRFTELAACFEALGGVPATALWDRTDSLKAAIVAGLVVPTADYVQFATHYGFRPDFGEGQDPESKGLVENPRRLREVRPHDPSRAHRPRPARGQRRGDTLVQGSERC